MVPTTYKCNIFEPIEPYWHMILGGFNGSALLDTVEMFNWKTHQQCYLKARLPITVSEHSGTVLDGKPVFCGGFGPDNSRQKGCYKYEKDNKTWINVKIRLHASAISFLFG